MTNNKQLSGAIQAASYNIIVQVMFRLQTFILNGFILRYISKDVLGIINVRLLLLYSTVLFLSKEAFRNACLSNTREHKWPKVINLLWLMVPTSVICSFILAYVWINLLEQPKETEILNQYSSTVIIISLCCILEMIAEPLYVVARIFLFNKLRAVNESLSVGLRCLALAIVVYIKPENAIYGFALGQVLCSSVWVIGVYSYFAVYFKYHKKITKLPDKNAHDILPFDNLRGFFPTWLPDESNFSWDQVALTWSFFKQGFLKQILTEGERYVMTLFDLINFAEQGVFDVVNNLGSIAARFIFRPVEDSSYQFFAGTVKRELSCNEQDQTELQLVAQFLQQLLRAMVLLGLIIVSFGYAYSNLLLDIYGGKLLSAGIGPTLLRWHCIYVLFLAINGVTECYVFATMSRRNVDNYNYLLVVLSIIFLLVSWFLTKVFGSVGFILANCINMIARIIYSCRFIHMYYKNSNFKPLSGLVPDSAVMLSLAASFIITSLSEAHFCCDSGVVHILYHIFVGCFCLAAVCALIILREKALLRFAMDLMRHKKTA